jgi:hypothetical protein
MKKLLYSLVVLSVFVGGCATHFNQVSDTYLPLEPNRPLKISYKITGEACETFLLGLIPVSGDNRVEKAIAEMTRNNEQIDNVVGLTVETRETFYVVAIQRCTIASGYPAMYVDNQPKRRLFSREFMEGPTAVAEPTPAPAAPAATPGAVPVDPSQVAAPQQPQAPAPQQFLPPPQPQAPALPTEAQCKKSCSRFAGLWKGSVSIKGTIERNCVNKCLTPAAAAYRDCINAASKVDDIGRCNNL